MQQFEEGKTYNVNGGGKITVTRRTSQFVFFTGTTRDGETRGRKKIYPDNLFGLGENILIPSLYPGLKYFCFAGRIDNDNRREKRNVQES